MTTLIPVSKIQNSHYERTAYVYVRQSTPLQVTENVESKERQYQLRQHAIDLGWSPSRVEVITKTKAVRVEVPFTARASSGWLRRSVWGRWGWCSC